LHEHPAVLGTLVLFACIGAAGFIACIGFVLFGPVPVNRKVTMVARIDAAPLPLAALPIEIAPPIAVPPAPPPPVPADAILRPDGTPFPPRQSRLQADGPIIQPMLRRRAGNTPPPTPPRHRFPRGTQEQRSRDTFDSVEVTAPHSSSFETEEATRIDDASLS
jgi:hypothetical protein